MSTETELPKLKCLIWDLDHTLWHGVLAEGDELQLRPGARELIETLDARGVLQSIASRNDHELAWAKLTELGLADYFLVPQINWGPKSESVAEIAETLNLGLDSFAFVDDQPFEREEVQTALPQVRIYDAADIATLVDRPEFTPRFVTPDSRHRRALYQRDFQRQVAEEKFNGPSEEFLRSLDLSLRIAPAEPGDLERAEELTLRTHQLNTTGRTFSHHELDQLRQSDDHILLVASLSDRFGDYGKIGLVLLSTDDSTWRIDLLLMSCRVMSRGVGGALITWLRQQAKATGVELQAQFVETDRNRMMYITYKFAGFEEKSEVDGVTLFENDLLDIPELPDYFVMDAQISRVAEATS
ncbi:HAD-IIIC family phosphatase [Opitutaceae bacterium]|nr:HAD-IIIC family phosphatase [Opitutaceae bacterium]